MFVIGAVNYDVPPLGDENEYIIYKQNPEAEEEIAGRNPDQYMAHQGSGPH